MGEVHAAAFNDPCQIPNMIRCLRPRGPSTNGIRQRAPSGHDAEQEGVSNAYGRRAADEFSYAGIARADSYRELHVVPTNAGKYDFA